MLVVEMENIEGVLDEARKTPKMVVYVKDTYSPSIKEENMIFGSLVVSTITKIQDETTIFFYEEQITTNKKSKNFEKKCIQERDLCIETLKDSGYTVKMGIIKQGA